MRPKTSHTRMRQPDDDERIQAAQAALKRHLPNLDTEGTEIMFRVFLWGVEPTTGDNDENTPAPIGLTKTRQQLDDLCAKALAFIDTLEAINENANIAGELYSLGLNIEAIQEKTRQAIHTARGVQGRLPKGTRWPKMPNPLHELIRQLAAAYEDCTMEDPRSGIKHSREPEQYYGSFFDLVSDITNALKIPYKSNIALGKAILDAL